MLTTRKLANQISSHRAYKNPPCRTPSIWIDNVRVQYFLFQNKGSRNRHIIYRCGHSMERSLTESAIAFVLRVCSVLIVFVVACRRIKHVVIRRYLRALQRSYSNRSVCYLGPGLRNWGERNRWVKRDYWHWNRITTTNDLCNAFRMCHQSVWSAKFRIPFGYTICSIFGTKVILTTRDHDCRK